MHLALLCMLQQGLDDNGCVGETYTSIQPCVSPTMQTSVIGNGADWSDAFLLPLPASSMPIRAACFYNLPIAPEYVLAFSKPLYPRIERTRAKSLLQLTTKQIESKSAIDRLADVQQQHLYLAQDQHDYV